ncbi:Uncharacterised protein [Chlamydia trachomatis]|nr:Uncharacterised protein [Chlamydia trachomatis]
MPPSSPPTIGWEPCSMVRLATERLGMPMTMALANLANLMHVPWEPISTSSLVITAKYRRIFIPFMRIVEGEITSICPIMSLPSRSISATVSTVATSSTTFSLATSSTTFRLLPRGNLWIAIVTMGGSKIVRMS